MLKNIPFTYNDRDDLFANTYVVIDENNNCLVVDPSVSNDGISNYITKNNLNLVAIVLTHGHFDHIQGIANLLAKKIVPIYMHEDEIKFLNDTELNCSRFVGKPFKLDVKVNGVTDGEVLKLLDEDVKIIHTPYHTIGSICLYFQDSKLLYSGDSLFKYSIGRSDLPTSNPRQMRESLSKILSLPEDVKILPGHGAQTSVGNEKKLNPFVTRL